MTTQTPNEHLEQIAEEKGEPKPLRPFLHCLTDNTPVGTPEKAFPGVYKRRAEYLASQGLQRCFSCGSTIGAETAFYKLASFQDIMSIARAAVYRAEMGKEEKAEALNLLGRVIDGVMFHDKSRD